MNDELKLYTCHKQVHATPMTRGAYNQYKGWDMPEGENGEDQGYLVIYNRDTKDHYESWSPKHIFDEGYTATKATPDACASADKIEQEIQAKGLTAPRVTPADIEASIASEHYFTALDGVTWNDPAHNDIEKDEEVALGLLTFCVLVLRNGFTVTGESACASPENFNAEIGRKIARENAINKVWMLEGYLLKQQLHDQAAVKVLTDADALADLNGEPRPDNHSR